MKQFFFDHFGKNPMIVPSYENYLQQRLEERIGGFSAVFDSPPGIGTHKEKVEKPKVDMGLTVNDGLEPEDDDEDANISVTDKLTNTLRKETAAVMANKPAAQNPAKEPPAVDVNPDKGTGANVPPSPPSNKEETPGAENSGSSKTPEFSNDFTQAVPQSVTDAPNVNGLQTRSWADRTRERMDIQLDLTRARVKARNQGKTALKGTIADIDDATWHKMKEERIKTAIEGEQNRRVANAATRNKVNNDLLSRYNKENPDQKYSSNDERIEAQRKKEWERDTNPLTNPKLAEAQAKNKQNAEDRAKYGGDPNEVLAGTKATRKDFYDRTGRAFGGDIRRDSDEAGRMRSEMNAAAEATRKEDREFNADVVNQTVGQGIPMDSAVENAKRYKGIQDEQKQNLRDKAKRIGSKYSDRQPRMTDIAESTQETILNKIGFPVMKVKINAKKI